MTIKAKKLITFWLVIEPKQQVDYAKLFSDKQEQG